MRAQRSRHHATAENLTRGRNGVEPPRRDLAQHTQRARNALELGKLVANEMFGAMALVVVDDDAGDLEVTGFERADVLVRSPDIARAGLGPPRRADDPSRRPAPTRRRSARASPCFRAKWPPAAPRARWQ